MSEAAAPTVQRPIGVAIVALLAGLSGVVDVITGILLMFEGGNPEIAEAFGGPNGVLAASIGSILLGVIVLSLSFGIWLGRWVARMIVTVLEALSLIQSLFLAVANLGNPVGEWASVFFSALVMILLWTRPSSAYFRGSEVAAR